MGLGDAAQSLASGLCCEQVWRPVFPPSVQVDGWESGHLDAPSPYWRKDTLGLPLCSVWTSLEFVGSSQSGGGEFGGGATGRPSTTTPTLKKKV